jgi:hypothetical protein
VEHIGNGIIVLSGALLWGLGAMATAAALPHSSWYQESAVWGGIALALVGLIRASLFVGQGAKD